MPSLLKSYCSKQDTWPNPEWMEEIDSIYWWDELNNFWSNSPSLIPNTHTKRIVSMAILMTLKMCWRFYYLAYTYGKRPCLTVLKKKKKKSFWFLSYVLWVTLQWQNLVLAVHSVVWLCLVCPHSFMRKLTGTRDFFLLFCDCRIFTPPTTHQLCGQLTVL